MLTTSTATAAILGGLLPTLVWLWFWLREDREHPEPKRLLALSFLFGALGVIVAVPLERFASSFLTAPLVVLFAWSFIEEMLKYVAAYAGGMHTQAEDEPIDAMIYLITAALGFAAAENTLFLLQPLMDGEVFTTLVTGNVRFIGTTLLHVLSSATVGAFIAFSFHKRRRVRIEYFLVGSAVAVTLHALFNFFIIEKGTEWMFAIFALVWIAIIGLLLTFERVKRIRY